MSRQQRREAERKARKGYQVPSGPPPGEARDERIAYGSGCTWWGTIYEIAVIGGPMPLPCCPYCGGMLYEAPSLDFWNQDVAAYAEQQSDPGYPAFVEWNHNRACLSLHPSRGGHTAFDRLRAQFEAERTRGAN